jgi:hypothetical protein
VGPLSKSRKLDQLVGRVECLLTHLPNDDTPELIALRNKVDHTIMETWIGVTREQASRSARAENARPLMIGTALLVGIAAGYAYAARGRRRE